MYLENTFKEQQRLVNPVVQLTACLCSGLWILIEFLYVYIHIYTLFISFPPSPK